MQDDPTISRIRAVRHQISAQYHHDVAQLIAHYGELEQRYHDRVIARATPNRDESSHADTLLVADRIKESAPSLVGNF